MKNMIFAIAVISTLFSMALTLCGFDLGMEHLTLVLRFNLFLVIFSVNDSIIIIFLDVACLEFIDWLGCSLS